MKLVNLTPHTISLPNGTTIEPTGYVARANLHSHQLMEWQGVTFFSSELRSISNVPPPETETYYIVPVIVRVNMPERSDLISPTRLIRNNKGEVVGCGAFEVNAGFGQKGGSEWSTRK